MPNIEGLTELVKRFPDRISHSRQYRQPDPFSNQTVLVVGAAVRVISVSMDLFADSGQTSGVGISRDIIRHVRKVYQSVRVSNKIK